MDSDNIYPPAELIRSPYLDMSLVPDTNKYIYQNANPKRGRWDHCLIQIGTAVIAGSGTGGFIGVIKGMKQARGSPARLYQTMVFNQIVKGSMLGNRFGIVAFLFVYSGAILSELRKKEDALNNIGASTVTGVVYQSQEGTRKMVNGGIIGFSLGTLLALWTQRSTGYSEIGGETAQIQTETTEPFTNESDIE